MPRHCISAQTWAPGSQTSLCPGVKSIIQIGAAFAEGSTRAGVMSRAWTKSSQLIFLTGASSPKASAASSQGCWAPAMGPPHPAPTLASWGLPRYLTEPEEQEPHPTPLVADPAPSRSTLWPTPTPSLRGPLPHLFPPPSFALHQAPAHLSLPHITGSARLIPPGPRTQPFPPILLDIAPPPGSLAGGQQACGAVWCGHHAGPGHYWQIHSPLRFAP